MRFEYGDVCFADVPGGIGNLTLRHMLLYYDFPIVFVCTDSADNTYLCLCPDTDYDRHWIIAQVPVKRIIQMMRAEITTLDTLQHSSIYGVLAEDVCGSDRPIYKIMMCSKFPDEFLPNEGVYWRADEIDIESFLANTIQ